MLSYMNRLVCEYPTCTYVTSPLACTLHPSPYLPIYQAIKNYAFHEVKPKKIGKTEKVKAQGGTSVKPHLSPYPHEYQRSKFQVKA